MIVQPYLIRPAAPEDREARRDVSHRTWLAAYEHIFPVDVIDRLFKGLERMYTEQWDAMRQVYLSGFVGEMDGRIVGHVGTALLTSGEGEVTVLYVLPEFHGLGIGRGLWTAAVDDLKGRGCPAVNVWVLEKAASVRFYEHMGCECVGQDVFKLGEHTEPILHYRLALE